MALIWDVHELPRPIDDPILAYQAGGEVKQALKIQSLIITLKIHKIINQSILQLILLDSPQRDIVERSQIDHFQNQLHISFLQKKTYHLMIKRSINSRVRNNHYSTERRQKSVVLQEKQQMISFALPLFILLSN